MGKSQKVDAVYQECIEIEYRRVQYNVEALHLMPQNTYRIGMIFDTKRKEQFTPETLEVQAPVLMDDKPLRTKGQVRAAALRYIEAWANLSRVR